jgi:hypothetical protein
MKRTFYISLIILAIASCNNPNKQDSLQSVNFSEDSLPEKGIEVNKNSISQKSDFENLKKYIGKYPKQTDFFDNPIIRKGLKEILKGDFSNYMNFVSMAGCGEMNYKYGLIYGDVSQLHVGGYSSLIFIDIDDKKMFLFWLKETVSDKKYKIYGQKPIQANVLNLIEQEMNISWGHVANFSIQGDSILIELK